MHLTAKTSNTQSKKSGSIAELIDKSMALIPEIGFGD